MRTYAGDEGHPRTLLVGPPGTGKTRTALHDFLLPALREHPPERVLACSFSNAAAGELRSRLATSLRVADTSLRLTASTIHSEALRVVRLTEQDLKLYDWETDTARTFSRADAPDTGEASAANTYADKAWSLARAIDPSRAQAGLEAALRVAAATVARERPDPQDVAAAKLVTSLAADAARAPVTWLDVVQRIERGEARKRELGALDFTDMLMRALHLPARLGGFALLLVDEVQDCTPLQWALVEHWARAASRVVLIGDPDQCIHEWAGVDYARMVAYARDPEWAVRVLSQSWRVPVAVHGVARAIAGMIRDREDAPYAPRDHHGSAGWATWDEVVAEAHAVAREYADAPEVVRNGEVVSAETRSMFILCRTNRQVDGVRRALNKAGIPYADEAPGEPVSVAPATAARVRTLLDLLAGEAVPAGAAAAMLGQLPAKEFFTGTRVDCLRALPEVGNVDLSRLVALGVRGLTVAAALPHLCGKSDPAYWLAVARDYGRWVLTCPAPIRVMTWHRSKGREADVVAVCGDRAGGAWRVGAVDDAELRAMYVAVTRARDRLIVYGEGETYVEFTDALKGAELPF